MFKREKYNVTLQNILEEGSLRGSPVKSYADIYAVIAREMNVSPETPKKWRSDKAGSPSPRTGEDISNLEEILGLPAGSLVIPGSGARKSRGEEVLTDFIKEKIFLAYECLRDFFIFTDSLDSGMIADLRYDIERFRPVLPKPVFEEFSTFIDMELCPVLERSHWFVRNKEVKHEIADRINRFGQEHVRKYFFPDAA